jgi:hypothetical protein
MFLKVNDTDPTPPFGSLEAESGADFLGGAAAERQNMGAFPLGPSTASKSNLHALKVVPIDQDDSSQSQGQ